MVPLILGNPHIGVHMSHVHIKGAWRPALPEGKDDAPNEAGKDYSPP